MRLALWSLSVSSATIVFVLLRNYFLCLLHRGKIVIKSYVEMDFADWPPVAGSYAGAMVGGAGSGECLCCGERGFARGVRAADSFEQEFAFFVPRGQLKPDHFESLALVGPSFMRQRAHSDAAV